MKRYNYIPWETKPKHKTNADRIRSMTDEELAEFMDGIDCLRCPVGDNCKIDACKNQLFKWLQQPAEE